jgi:4-hydroxy-tetrahydrodipicolinate reductase
MVLRVVVGYTGGVGAQVLRLLLRDPGFDVAGVLVHHAEKDGRDIGELAGLDPVGMAATRDVDRLVALKADVLSWHGRTWEPSTIARFLRAGTSVYSGIGGWFLPGRPEFAEIQAAAEAGGAAFIAGGSIPGLVSDVLPLFVSGYSAEVRMVRAWQSNHVAHYPSAAQLEQGLGFGVPVEPGAGPSPVDEMWLWGIEQSARIVAAGLGIPFDEVRITGKEFGRSPEDMVLEPSGLRVAKGTPAGVRWTFTAFSRGAAFYELVNEQTARLDLGEGWRSSEQDPNWRVLIEGTPSITCQIGFPDEENGTDQGSALNAARAVNFLPRIAAAAPGWRTVLDVPAPVGTRLDKAPG